MTDPTQPETETYVLSDEELESAEHIIDSLEEQLTPEVLEDIVYDVLTAELMARHSDEIGERAVMSPAGEAIYRHVVNVVIGRKLS